MSFRAQTIENPIRIYRHKWSLQHADGRKIFNAAILFFSLWILIRIPIDVCECMDAHKNSRQMIYVNCLKGLNRILNAISSPVYRLKKFIASNQKIPRW